MMRSVLIMILMVVVYFFVLIVPEQKKKHGGMEVFWRRFMSKQGAAPWLLAFVIFEVFGWSTFGRSGILSLYLSIAMLMAAWVCMGIGMYKMVKEAPEGKKSGPSPAGRKLRAYWKVMPPVPWIVLGCVVAVVGGFMADEKKVLGPVLLAVGVLLVGLGIVRAVGDRLSGIRKEQNDLLQAKVREKLSFYEECGKNGIVSCQTPKEIQKATLIAQRMKLPFEDIRALYTEARILHERKEQGDTFETLAELRHREKECREASVRYAGYTGRDKRVAMLTDLWQQAREEFRSRLLLAGQLRASTQEKEKIGRSWAALRMAWPAPPRDWRWLRTCSGRMPRSGNGIMQTWKRLPPRRI